MDTLIAERLPFDHVVHFFDSEEALGRKVSAFIGAALGAGQVGLIIAAKSRRARFKELLQDQVNLPAAEKAGRLLMLDAEETLARFMNGDEPDPQSFERVIGGLVKEATRGGRTLRAYGEMVALLQAQGNIGAAIRLEELWNDLGRKHRFSLFCAYPAAKVGPDQRSLICVTHSEEEPSAPGAADSASPVELMLSRRAGVQSELEERLRVERELRRSREELRSFVENASVGLHWVGPDGVIKWANEAECRMLGYSREEYVGQHISKFHADRRAIDDILARLTRGERLVEREARLKCKDGSIKIVLIDSCVLFQDGRFVHTQCFTRDVTRQRQAERASQHLAAVVESSEDAIISQDLQGTILSWNRSAERLFGYGAQEIIGRKIALLIPEGLRTQEAVILARIASGERVEHFETARRRKDGGLVEVSLSVSPIRGQDGAIVGVSKVVRDITERKRAQAAIRTAEETNRYLAEVIESADTPIMGIDLDGKINAWNQGAAKLFGYAKAEILGRELGVLAAAESHGELRRILSQIKAGESPQPYEAVRLRKDRTPLRVSIKVSPVRSPEGVILGGSAIIRESPSQP